MTNYSIIPGILSGITSVSMNYPFETIKSNIISSTVSAHLGIEKPNNLFTI